MTDQPPTSDNGEPQSVPPPAWGSPPAPPAPSPGNTGWGGPPSAPPVVPGPVGPGAWPPPAPPGGYGAPPTQPGFAPGAGGGWPPPTTTPPPVPPRRTGPWPIIAGVVVVLVVFLVGAILAVSLLGGSSDEKDAAPSTSLYPSPSPTTTPSTPSTTEGGGPGPSTTESTGSLERPPVPDGYKSLASDEDGWAMVIPESWSSAEITPEGIDKAIADLRPTRPDLAATLEQFKALAGTGVGGLAFAYGDPTAAERAGSVNLVRAPGGGVTVDQLAAQAKIGLQTAGAKEVTTERVTVGGRDGVRATATLTAPGGQSVSSSQLYLVVDGEVYVLTVSGNDPEVADTVIDSLRIRG